VLRLDQHANSTCNEIKIPGDQIIAIIGTRATPSEAWSRQADFCLESLKRHRLAVVLRKYTK